ncbi:hypothetical protein QBC45DRAFT_409738 [Copromyces sp. CBS 386.78]|nr:hypothetical protein QBC45DRAFT_409738 [Copromyces sp. CBS 386.78]
MAMSAAQASFWLLCDGEPHCLRGCPGCLIWPRWSARTDIRQSCHVTVAFPPRFLGLYPLVVQDLKMALRLVGESTCPSCRCFVFFLSHAQ